MIRSTRQFLHQLPTWVKKVALMGLDAVLIPFSLWAALSLRFGQWLTDLNPYLLPAAALAFFTVALFIRLGLYRMVLRYIGWRLMGPVVKGGAGVAVEVRPQVAGAGIGRRPWRSGDLARGLARLVAVAVPVRASEGGGVAVPVVAGAARRGHQAVPAAARAPGAGQHSGGGQRGLPG